MTFIKLCKFRYFNFYLINIFLILLIIFSLSSCSNIFSQKKIKISGKRVSALALENSLDVDPSIKSPEVKLPKPYINKNWSQDGGSSNNAMNHLSIAENPKLVWRVRVGKNSDRNIRLVASPIVHNNKVYVLDGQSNLTSLNLLDGKKIWKINLTPKGEAINIIGGGLAATKSTIFVTTGYGDVFAIDSKDGKIIWNKKLKVPLRGAPTVAGEKIFFLSVDNKVFALDINSGLSLWMNGTVAESISILGGGSPAYFDGIVVVPYTSGDLVALNAESGSVIWVENLIRGKARLNLSQLNDANSKPVIDNGILYAIGSGGKMISVDLQTGNRFWSKELGGKSSPWIGGNFLFTITHQNQLVAISKDDGMIRWINQLPRFFNEKKQEKKVLWNGPILASDRLLSVSSSGLVLSISPYTGKILGEVKISSGTFIESIIADRTFLVLSNDGKLSAFR